MAGKPNTIAVPQVTVVHDHEARHYLVRCAACGVVDTMLTQLGAADMRGWHRRLHIANRLGLGATTL